MQRLTIVISFRLNSSKLSTWLKLNTVAFDCISPHVRVSPPYGIHSLWVITCEHCNPITTAWIAHIERTGPVVVFDFLILWGKWYWPIPMPVCERTICDFIFWFLLTKSLRIVWLKLSRYPATIARFMEKRVVCVWWLENLLTTYFYRGLWNYFIV